MSGAWTLPVLIWAPIGAVLTVATSAVSLWAFRNFRRDRSKPKPAYSDDPSAWLFLAIPTALAALGMVVGSLIGFYPYSAQYHWWQPTSGLVTARSSRLLSDGNGGVNQRFVVTLAGVGQRSCDDTRCAEVKVGDRLHLSCKRAWQYAGSDGWDCNFVSLETKS